VVSHRLRAADALQLAAALVWCSNRPRGRAFLVADGALSDAAEAEGFAVIRVLCAAHGETAGKSLKLA